MILGIDPDNERSNKEGPEKGVAGPPRRNHERRAADAAPTYLNIGRNPFKLE